MPHHWGRRNDRLTKSICPLTIRRLARLLNNPSGYTTTLVVFSLPWHQKRVINNLLKGMFQFGLTDVNESGWQEEKEESCADGGVKRSNHHSTLHHQKVNGVYGSWTSTAVPDQGCYVTEKKKPEKPSKRAKKKNTETLTKWQIRILWNKRKTSKRTQSNKHM